MSKRILLTVLAMGGILLDKITALRILLFFLIAIVYIFFNWLLKEISSESSVLIFTMVFIGRYVFLFLSFIKNGIADCLKREFGEYNGFEIYKILTALLFFLSASSFSLMIFKSKFALPHYNQFNQFFIAIGIMAILIGMITNVWSALLIGIDLYYYKDLFLGRFVGELKNSGPYAILANPMYSVGQANGYGTALIYGSVIGIVFILLNQTMMYIFFWTIEKPHIKKILYSLRNES